MLKKAAVVIGVDKPGNYTPLKSAASGAEEIATWLNCEGYDVTCLTDKNGIVSAQDAKSAILACQIGSCQIGSCLNTVQPTCTVLTACCPKLHCLQVQPVTRCNQIEIASCKSTSSLHHVL